MKILFFALRVVLRVIYLWMWWIPSRMTVLAIAGYFGLMYLIFDTVHVSIIKAQLDGVSYFWGFILPFALPMFIAFICAFALVRHASPGNSLQQLLRYRNGQMSVKPDKQAAAILIETSYLDMLSSGNSEVFEQARRGFNATYGNKPPNEVFRELMNDD